MKRVTPLLLLLLLVGCTSPSYFESGAYQRSNRNWTRTAALDAAPPHDRPMLVARGPDAGRPLHWPALRDALRWADVVILGERHNDVIGHDTKTQIIALYNRPAVVAMEQFTRDQQVYLDDWRMDIGVSEDHDAFDILSGRTDLWNDFETYYLPFIEIAKSRGWPVVASNAPRQYVRLARTDGYARLRHLTPEQRATFDIPRTLPTGEYRDRFMELMSGLQGHGGAEIDLEALYRSQALWDATMAASILEARSRHRGALVFHVNGAFHSDDDGGIVAMLRRAAPGIRILNISLVPKDGPDLDELDRGIADIVIYTGEIEEPEMPEEMPAAEGNAEEAPEHPEMDPAEGGDPGDQVQEPETSSDAPGHDEPGTADPPIDLPPARANA